MCPDCSSNDVNKAGFQNGEQRYKCKRCGRSFTSGVNLGTSSKKHSRKATEIKGDAQVIPRVPWYQKPWGIVLLMLLFAPAGIFIMYKHTQWSKSVKLVLALVFGLTFIFAWANALFPPAEDYETIPAIAGSYADAYEPAPPEDDTPEIEYIPGIEYIPAPMEDPEPIPEEIPEPEPIPAVLDEPEEPATVPEVEYVPEPETIAPESPPESTQNIGRTVWWVQRGEVYHTRRGCPALSNATNIQSGANPPAGRRHCRRC